MSKTNNNRIPKSERPVAKKLLSRNEVFGDTYAMPDEIKKELESKGLEGRWLNAKQLFQNNGYHKSGWQVYKRDNHDNMSTAFKAFGDPDGLVRRGDTVLGVKTKEAAEKHRAYLRQQADAQSMANVKKRHIEELKHMAREGNIDVVIKSEFDGE